MAVPSDLGGRFVSLWRPASPFPGPAALDRIGELLGGALSEARERWPQLALAAEAFLAHLADLAPLALASADELVAFLERACLVNLYLVCACLEAVPGAVATFEREQRGSIDRFLRHVNMGDAQRGEVRQQLMEKLFVAPAGGRAKIATYAGRGSLSRWTGIAAQRLAIESKRREQGQRIAGTPRDSDLLEQDLFPDPEIDLFRRKYRAEFEKSFAEALSAQPERERLLLKLNLVNGLSMERIGVMYGVNQSTVSRWLAKTREAVVTEVQRRLSERLHLSSGEMASLIRAVRSDVDISVSRVLGAVQAV